MPAFEQVRRRLRTAHDLLGVVRTLKVIAAVNIRQYQRAVAALGDYVETIEQGLYVVLRDRAVPLPAAGGPGGRTGCIVFGTDQGLCGPLNRQVADHARDALGPAADSCLLLAAGSRAADACDAAGLNVAETVPLPASLAGITPLVQELLLRLDDWHTRSSVQRILLCHHVPHSSSSSAPQTVGYLPLDPGWLQGLLTRRWESRTLPVFRGDRDRLLTDLLRQHLFTRLYRAAAEALASENAARLAAMQRAEKNIAEHGQELQRQFHRLRQTAITDELLDLVAGSEALLAGTA